MCARGLKKVRKVDESVEITGDVSAEVVFLFGFPDHVTFRKSCARGNTVTHRLEVAGLKYIFLDDGFPVCS